MLFTSETKVISVLIFDLNESGDLGAIAVLGIIMLVITFAVVFLANRYPALVFAGIVSFVLVIVWLPLGVAAVVAMVAYSAWRMSRGSRSVFRAPPALGGGLPLRNT